MTAVPGARSRALRRAAVLLVLVAAAAVAAVFVPLPSQEQLRAAVGAAGWWGPAAFVLGYAALTLAPLPKSVLSVGAGLVFGFTGGLVLVYAAAMLGATAAFWLGRRLGREAVEKYTGARVERVDELLRRRGLLAVIGVRLIPVLPFTAINYAAGLTSVGWWQYFLGTVIGILPGTVSYVLLGAYGLQMGWEAQLAAAVLGLLTVAGIAAAVVRRRKARVRDV